nr:hypothetical protein [uncultured Sphingomonas sp.]
MARFAQEAGQAPEFKVETGKVEMGTREANVAVPKVEVTKDNATVNVPAVEVRRAGESTTNAN